MDEYGLNVSKRMDMLFTPMEREQSSSNMKHMISTSGLYSQALSAIEKEIEQAKSNMQLNRLPQVGSFPMDGFSMTAYGQPSMPWTYLSSPFQPEDKRRQPMLQGKLTPQAHIPAVGETVELRCTVCGIACATVAELLNHIAKKHIESEPDKRILNSEMELMQRRDFVSSVQGGKEDKNVSKTPQRKHSVEASLNMQESDKNSADFPIPTPNFALLNSYSKLPSINPTLDTIHGSSVYRPAKIPVNGLRPPFQNLQLKTPPSPMLMGAYMLNPLLGCQTFGNENNIALAGSAPGKHPPSLPINGAVTGFPFLAPGGGYLPGRLPYLPTVPISVPQNSVHSALDLIKSNPLTEDVLLADRISSKNDIVMDKSKEQKQNPNVANIRNLYASSHADSLRRRLSVPTMSPNQKFRTPYPYIRKTSISNGGHCSSFSQHKEAVAEQLQHARKSSHQSALNKKRMSLTENPSHSRLNAKSIEQHISKLISNNEKVLLNPALERVKPRRVFRRNSLDPASLSSYAAAISGRLPRDLPLFKEDEADLAQKMYGLPSSSATLASTAGHQSSSAALLRAEPPEFKSMVQLTRVPQSDSQFSNTIVGNDSKEPSRLAMQHLQQREGQDKASRGSLDNHNPFQNSGRGFLSHTKKPRRTTFFECSDCGVRYRNEENYKIHKQMYCNYKYILANSANEAKTVKCGVLEKTMQSRRHSDLPEIHRASVMQKLPDSHSSNNTIVLSKSAEEILLPNPAILRNNSEFRGKYANGTHVTLKPQVSPDPVKLVQSNEVRRRKSAEAMLQTDVVVHDEKHLRSKQTCVHVEATESTKRTKTIEKNCSVAISMETESCAPSMSQVQSCMPCPTNLMPTSKLPPNKRHLMRHFEKRNYASDESQLSAMDCSGNEVLDTSHIEISKTRPATGTTSPCSHANTISTAAASVVSSCGLIPFENSLRDFIFDEAAMPRRGNKHLSHRKSSECMQSINQVTSSPEDECIWSWQQIRKGLFTPKWQLEDARSLFKPPNIPQIRGKFSVPSLLPQDSKLSSNGDTSELQGSTENRLKLERDFPSALVIRSDLIENDVNFKAHDSVDSISPALKEQVATPCSKAIETSRSIAFAHNATASELPCPSTGCESSGLLTSQRHFVSSPSVGRLPASLDGVECRKCLDQTHTIATAKALKDGLKPHFDELPITKDDKTLTKMVSNVTTSTAVDLHPHLKPTLTAHTDLSYCCVIDLQPTCMEISQPKDSKDTPLSMYKDWTTAKPLILPPDLRFADPMAGWRRSRSEGGVVAVVKNNCDLILTQNETYNKFKCEIKARIQQNEPNSTLVDGDVSTSENVSIGVNKNHKEADVPVYKPSVLLNSVVNLVYASCHCPQGITAVKSESTAPTVGSTTGTNHNSVSSNHPDASTKTTTDSTGLNCQKITLPKTSQKETGKRKENLTDFPSPPDYPKPKHAKQNSRPMSSSSATDSDSDPVNRRINLLGKVKRRRSRKERTASSPRAKRRALQCISPLSHASVVPPQDAAQKKNHHSVSECGQEFHTALKLLHSASNGIALNHGRVSETEDNGSNSAAAQSENSVLPSASRSNTSSGTMQEVSTSPPIGFALRSEDPACKANDIPSFVGVNTASTPSPTTDEHHFRPDGSFPGGTDMTSATTITSSTQIWSTKPHLVVSDKRTPQHSGVPPLLERSDNCDISMVDLTSYSRHGSRTTLSSHSQSSIPVAHPRMQAQIETPVSKTGAQLKGAEKRGRLAATSTPRPFNEHDAMASECPSSFRGSAGRHDVASLRSHKCEFGLNQANPQSSAATTEVVSQYSQKLNSREPDIDVEESRERPALKCMGYSSHELDLDAGYRRDTSRCRNPNTLKNVIDDSRGLRIGHKQSEGENDKRRDVICEDLLQSNITLPIAPSQLQVDMKPNNKSSLETQNSSERSCEGPLSLPMLCDDPVKLAGGPQDPRPFKCLSCGVSFRFQGHLDRHHRSNVHLFTISHCTQDGKVSETLVNDDDEKLTQSFERRLANEVECEPLIRQNPPSLLLNNRVSSMNCKPNTQLQANESTSSGSVALKSGSMVKDLPGHQAISQLGVHPNGHSDSGHLSHPHDSMPRNAPMQCHISCS